MIYSKLVASIIDKCVLIYTSRANNFIIIIKARSTQKQNFLIKIKKLPKIWTRLTITINHIIIISFSANTFSKIISIKRFQTIIICITFNAFIRIILFFAFFAIEKNKILIITTNYNGRSHNFN